MNSKDLDILVDRISQKLWDKLAVLGAASLFRTMQSQPASSAEPDDYISTEKIIAEFGVSKQWLYKQRKRYPQCSRLVKNNPHDQRGKRFWSRSYIKKIIHESTDP